MKRDFLRILILGAWVALVVLLLFNNTVFAASYNFCIEFPVLAPLLLVFSQLLLSVFALPCSPITIVAGMLWGVPLAFCYSVIATTVASSFTFFLGRNLLQKKIHSIIPRAHFDSVYTLIERHTWKASTIAHINPLFPGSSLGYIFGSSNVDFRPFVVGVLFGTTPLQLILVIAGDQVVNRSLVYVFVGILLLGFVGALMAMIRKKVRKNKKS